MHEVEEIVTQSAVHIVANGKQSSATLELHEGESALVGGAVGCQLKLEGKNVAPHQCMLQLLDGILILDNWCEDRSTKVNGKSVEEQVTLGLGDIISFGSYQLQFSFDSPPSAASSSINTRSSDHSHIESNFRVPEEKVEPVESSTIAVLYSEISFLQRELEQRDSALAQASTKSDATDGAEGEHTNSRLNELLAELEVTDRRLLGLTDEVRLLEELRVAEQEEHHQITQWVNDVENLIAKRDAETLAQMDRLRAQLEQEKKDSQFHQQRADALVADSGKKELQVALNDLRLEYESLREKYKDTSDRTEQLQEECKTLRAANTDSEVERRIHEAVRAEQLELTQERANLSRREHDLAVKLRQMEMQMSAENVACKETEDNTSEDADKDATTRQLLANLWRTLDGKSHE